MDFFRQALARRTPLLDHLAETDCYRLFHGITEGVPGLAIDRYGPTLLLQTWREPLQTPPEAFAAVVSEELGVSLTPVWNHRKKPRRTPFSDFHAPRLPEVLHGRECGVRFHVHPRHRGIDPLLFLDFRAARRRIREVRGSVLNLFSYTCGIGVCAALGGANEVINVDFAASALAWGQKNAALNGVTIKTIQEDVFPIIRQFAGLRVSNRRPFTRVQKRTFDVVVLDPPRLAKGAWGAVDVVRDYQSLFKPAWLIADKALLATNNAAQVDRDTWLADLDRCARKAGKPIGSVSILEPEADFPSFDGRPPLKMAWLEPAR